MTLQWILQPLTSWFNIFCWPVFKWKEKDRFGVVSKVGFVPCFVGKSIVLKSDLWGKMVWRESPPILWQICFMLKQFHKGNMGPRWQSIFLKKHQMYTWIINDKNQKDVNITSTRKEKTKIEHQFIFLKLKKYD